MNLGESRAPISRELPCTDTEKHVQGDRGGESVLHTAMRTQADHAPSARLLTGNLSLAALCVLIASAACTWWVGSIHETELSRAVRHFREESADLTQARADVITEAFEDVYQGIRTIARLPGVREPREQGSSRRLSARIAAQEIYNGLATDVVVAEIHITELRAEDFTCKEPIRPSSTFDRLVVDRITNDATGDRRDIALARNTTLARNPDGMGRVLRRQVDWFIEHCPTESYVQGLAYPAVAGPEMATGRSAHVARDVVADDAGIVYSVPIFSTSGKLHGVVSAVIRAGTLREMLLDGASAIRHADSDLGILPNVFGMTRLYRDEIRQLRPADELLYSEVVDLNIADGMGKWVLWTGRPDSDFDASPAVRAADVSALAAYLGVGAITGMLLLIIRSASRSLENTRRLSDDLTIQVEARTADLVHALAAADRASRAKSDFLANMSHEIRTPMTAILGYADLLQDPGIDAVERTAHIQTMRKQGEHLLMMVNDILDLSKIEAGAMTVERIETDPIQIIEDILSLMRVRAMQAGVELKAEYAWPLPATITSDPMRVRQILINLVGNALKFTHHGGVVIKVGFDRSSSLLCVDVTDSGIGISREQMKELFRPFSQGDASVTRRYGGTGLGLSISHKLAMLLGGSLTATSVAGEGSTFSFTVATGEIDPSTLRTTAVVATPAAPAAPTISSASCRVLLAEDGPDNQKLISFHLKRAGHVVEVVGNGRQAVERAQAAWAHGEPFEVILMDMQMPELDGYSAASLLRQRGYRGPIIALTAHALPGDREKCLQAGCNDHLVKPISPHKLNEACVRWAGEFRLHVNGKAAA
jgi:signal transduction histidine kinase/CheY-like chemotaxis protein